MQTAALPGATVPKTLLTGLAVLLAAGCTVGGQQPRPTPAPLAAPTPTSADPIARLRRPLRLPVLKPGAPCPVARAHRVDPAFAEVLGNGPAYPTAGAGAWRQGRVEGGWYYAKVLWVASPAHPGPFLVRGRQLDGPRQLRFGEDPSPLPSCCLLPVGPRTTWTATGSTGRPTAACVAGAATPTRSTVPAAPR
jgi:hypothetical protein